MMLNICVIDDEEAIRDTFRWYLEEQGHKVTTFATPLEMVAHCTPCRLQSGPCFDALFIDQNMPSMTGLEFLKQSKSTCKIDSCRKFLMSAALNFQIILCAQRLGVKTLQKPLSFESLSSVIAQISKPAD